MPGQGCRPPRQVGGAAAVNGGVADEKTDIGFKRSTDDPIGRAWVGGCSQ